jgi:hypothetical protein
MHMLTLVVWDLILAGVGFANGEDARVHRSWSLRQMLPILRTIRGLVFGGDGLEGLDHSIALVRSCLRKARFLDVLALALVFDEDRLLDGLPGSSKVGRGLGLVSLVDQQVLILGRAGLDAPAITF